MFQLDDYDFDLPPSLIAQTPTDRRDGSRLMCVDVRSGQISHHLFDALPDLIRRAYPESTFGVLANRSKVIPARLVGRRELEGGPRGRVEVFLLEPIDLLKWKVMLKMSKPPKLGGAIRVRFESGRECIVRRESASAQMIAEFSSDPLIHDGQVPLPPYIERAPTQLDTERYQTVYAKEEGSVAAPTAGLHFSEALRRRCMEHPFEWREVILHVGLGTFKPVLTSDIREHRMHAERFEVPEDTRQALERWQSTPRHKTICIGTTSLRVLESVAEGRRGTTDIFLHANNPPKHVDALVTNFHWPKSTLVVLVSALAGYALMRRAYELAIAEKYRFASYGDAMLILK